MNLDFFTTNAICEIWATPSLLLILVPEKKLLDRHTYI